MVEPPATPARERWLHIVRDGESESAPPAPDDDPAEEPRRPALPSVFSRTPPGGPKPGGWAPPDRTTATPPRTPTPLPDSGRAHGGPTDAGSGTPPPSTSDTVDPAGYASLAKPPPGPTGDRWPVSDGGVAGAGGRAAVGDGPRSPEVGVGSDGGAGAAGGWALPGSGERVGPPGPSGTAACLSAPRGPGAAPPVPRPGNPGSPGTAVRGFERSRCRGRAIASAFGRPTGPRRVGDPGGG